MIKERLKKSLSVFESIYKVFIVASVILVPVLSTILFSYLGDPSISLVFTFMCYTILHMTLMAGVSSMESSKTIDIMKKIVNNPKKAQIVYAITFTLSTLSWCSILFSSNTIQLNEFLHSMYLVSLVSGFMLLYLQYESKFRK